MFVTAHCRGLAFLAHAADPASVSPTLVTESLADGSERHLMITERFSGGSIAVPHNGRFYVGAVFDGGLFTCDFKE